MRTRQFLTANDEPGRHAPSWYAATAEPEEPRPPLDGQIRADVCIAGAGFTGISAALHLAEAGLRVVVLEANRVGWGASGRNGGQLGSGQRVGQLRLEKWFGREQARRLWQIGEEAKALVRDRISRHGIECFLRDGVLHTVHRRRLLRNLREEVAHLNEAYGYTQYRFVDAEELHAMLGAEGYFGGALDSGAGHLHPLCLAQGLARAAESAGGADLREHAGFRLLEGIRRSGGVNLRRNGARRSHGRRVQWLSGRARSGVRGPDPADQQFHPRHRTAGGGACPTHHPG